MIMKFLRERREKKKYIVVHTHTEQAKWTQGNAVTLIILHLSENGYGERKMEVTFAGDNTDKYNHEKLHSYLKGQKFYYEKIVPWLSGRECSEIDTYSQAKQGDCVEALKRVAK